MTWQMVKPCTQMIPHRTLEDLVLLINAIKQNEKRIFTCRKVEEFRRELA